MIIFIVNVFPIFAVWTLAQRDIRKVIIDQVVSTSVIICSVFVSLILTVI
jgi:hypothetical protein